MAALFGSMRDWWRYQIRLMNPAYQARHSGGESAVTLPLRNSGAGPHPGLVTDPVSSLAKASEHFAAWQIVSGFEILKNHQGVETASDAHNVMLAVQHTADLSTATGGQPFSPLDQPWHAQPLNDPLAPTGMSGAPAPGM
jgi:hypothetical protein